MKEADEAHGAASVLVIAADPNIESLVGELVAFAGHRPMYDVTLGAAGESIRWTRPDVALIDTSLPHAVVRACLGAADELGSRVVLISSTASPAELADEAAAEHTLHFALPGGPAQLRNVLERALELRPSDAKMPDVPPRAARRASSAHPALRAALAGVARVQLLSSRAAIAVDQTRALRDAGYEAQSAAKRSQAALRAAVVDYASQLKTARVPESDAVVQVRDTVADCAAIVGAEPDVDSILYETERWAREVYRAT